MKSLVISIILLTFVGCKQEETKTAIYFKECNDKGCFCKGYTGKSISIFKCDSTLSVGDTISSKTIQ